MALILIASPLVASACFGLLGPGLAERLDPRQASWLLSIGSALVTASAVAALALVSSGVIGQVPPLADHVHVSASALLSRAPVDRLGTLLGTFFGTLAIAAGLLSASRELAALQRAHGDARAMSASTGIVSVADAPFAAVAVPGRPGVIVVSKRLMDQLSEPQRRALLGHERSHLIHRHHLHRAAVVVASAVIPVLRPLRAAIVLSTERWADEDAARVAGRRVIATAVARTALLDRSAAPAAVGLAASGGPTASRVLALLGAPPRPRPLLLAASAGLLCLAAIATVILAAQTDHLFDYAQHAYEMQPR